MKYAIFSDVHGNYEALKTVLKRCSYLNIDKYVCLGDIVGYGPQPKKCIDRLRSMENISIVSGNHEELVYRCKMSLLRRVNHAAGSAAIWHNSILDEKDLKWLEDLPRDGVNEHFEYSHANLFKQNCWSYVCDYFSIETCFMNMDKNIGFIGHTHVPAICSSNGDDITIDYHNRPIKMEDRKYLINVGSVGQPRDCDPRSSFVIYDTDKNLLRFHRTKYDAKKVRQQILDNHKLNPNLGERLLTGN